MEYLFSYGTLQQKDVQLDTFYRELTGIPDILEGFVLSQVKIEDLAVIKSSNREYHPILKKSSSSNYVEGTIFEITTDELKNADSYEVDAYKRVKLSFKSGKSAWVYVDSSDNY